MSPGMVFVVTAWRILVIDSDGGGIFGISCSFCFVDGFGCSERKKEVWLSEVIVKLKTGARQHSF